VLDEGGARPPEFFAAEIKKRAPAFGLILEPRPAARLARYLVELDRWRRRTNLTGPLPSEELVIHALESSLGEKVIAHGTRLLDIGSGAGFPGLPIAIIRPDLSVVLLEPRRRRAAFLRHAARAVPVENAEIREERVQSIAGQAFDVAAVRAVGSLAETLGNADFLRARGRLLVWTTDPRGLAQSLEAVFRLETTVSISGTRNRCLAVLEKR